MREWAGIYGDLKLDMATEWAGYGLSGRYEIEKDGVD